jgi:hypothetical protein
MTRLDLERHAFSLSIEDQLDLAETLWEHASPPVAISSDGELGELLDARREQVLRSPEASRPWAKVKARLLQAT